MKGSGIEPKASGIEQEKQKRTQIVSDSNKKKAAQAASADRARERGLLHSTVNPAWAGRLALIGLVFLKAA
jgi:hypothetical protein